MSYIVYWTTTIKPMDEVVVAVGYQHLLIVVPAEEIEAQAYLDTAPRDDDSWHGAAFRLTEKGINLFRHGVAGPPYGFREWPEGKEEPDWTRYPIGKSLSLK